MANKFWQPGRVEGLGYVKDCVPDVKELSTILLRPGEAIPNHRHTDDSEVYIIYENGKSKPKIHYCPKGKSHGYHNKTNHDVTISAIKFHGSYKEREVLTYITWFLNL